jgi:hypothetical protein
MDKIIVNDFGRFGGEFGRMCSNNVTLGLGHLWMIGWLFTIGYLRLSFWQGVLGLIIWPYYLGKHYHKGHN